MTILRGKIPLLRDFFSRLFFNSEKKSNKKPHGMCFTFIDSEKLYLEKEEYEEAPQFFLPIDLSVGPFDVKIVRSSLRIRIRR